jgi:phosphohistidine phosphatase SixA
MRFAPDAAIAQWTAQREQMRGAGFTPELARQFVDVRRRLVRAFHRAGVPLMAGSDTAQAFHVWGPGLLEEIEAFAAAGLTPMEALRTATVVPRDYFRSLPNGGSALGWKADFGTVEAGARADLILVQGDPSKDLKALRNLKTVIAGGRVHDRAALDALLQQAALDAKRPAPQAAAPARAAGRVYVMRHLHTTPGTPDPELTPEGAAAAAVLPARLASADIKAIFVTDTRRSRATAAPVAAKLGLTPTVYDPRNPAALAEQVASIRGDVLVVGHSNTVADLVARFGGAPITPPKDTDFGTVWSIEGPNQTRVLP